MRAREEGTPVSDYCRLWFVPKKVTLVESEDGTAMAFNEARMKVLTESKFRKQGIVKDKAAEKFARHFTQHYDDFSREYPILAELKRLGKITAIVKWIHEKNLPFDLSFFQSYIPNYQKTPKYSPLIVNALREQYIIGGVVYTLNEDNFFVQKNEQTDQIKEEILRNRPDDETLSWNFGRGMTAVANQVGKSLKVGEIRKTFVDFSYPGGGIPLSFIRTYSSFSDESFPMGRGWDIVPAKISFSRGRALFNFNDGTTLNVYPQITVRLEGTESIYTLSGLNQEKKPVYRTERGSSFLFQDSQGDFIWHRKNETLIFNAQGQLTNLLDQNKEGLEYHYEEGYLTQISHTSGQAITLEYVDGHLHSVAGPGGKTLYYEYGLEGRLQEVRDNEGTLSCYDYDDGNRLAAIYNGRGNKIFSAKYDEYHRATEQVIGENLISQAFNLRDRYASIEGVANAYEHHFDPEYRPKLIQDALGREIEFTYGKESGPQKVTTSTGLEIEYEYDSQGNLIKVIDQYEGERRFSYNSQEKISSEIDGEGNKVLYQYDPQGRLIEVYRPFLLSSVGVIDGQAVIEGDIRYLTTFEYDGDSNLLKSITYPDGQKETYCYNALGLPVQIKLPNGIIVDRKYDERNRLIEVQSQGKVVKYDYDTRDQIIKTTSGQKSSHFSYDASGNLSSLTDASDRVTEYEYDSYEKLVKTIDPLRHSSTYEYCPSGLSTITLPNGSIREIFYDEYSRPVAIR